MKSNSEQGTARRCKRGQNTNDLRGSFLESPDSSGADDLSLDSETTSTLFAAPFMRDRVAALRGEDAGTALVL